MNSKTGRLSSKMIACLLAVYLIWGSTYHGMKIAPKVVPPIFMSAMRFLVAGSLLLLIGYLREKSTPTRQQFLSACFVGIMLIGIGNTTVALAVHYMPSGLVALMVAAMPAWIMGMDWAFFSKQRPSTLTLVGIVIGFVGLFLLFNPFVHHEARTFPLWPVAIVVAGNICWAAGTLFVQRLPMPTQITSTAIQMLAGGIFSLLISFIFEPGALTTLSAMTTEAWQAYLYLVLIGSLVGYTSYSWLSKNAPPGLTATYAYVNPVVALILGYFIGSEAITTMVGVAAAVVISGVVMMTLGRR
jgi:drug/metabolite transporter (DMT)-like permease